MTKHTTTVPPLPPECGMTRCEFLRRSARNSCGVFIAWPISSHVLAGQAPEPIPTTVTTLARRPGDFAGRIVSVKSQVILGRGSLMLTEGDYRILICEPDSSEVRPKPPFGLIADAKWHELKDMVLPHPQGSRQQVTAIVEGRFDSAARSWKRRLLGVGTGFGHQGLYDHRIVIHRVRAVETRSSARRSEHRPLATNDFE